MDRVKHKRETGQLAEMPTEPNDVEIVEVVGMDDDALSPTATGDGVDPSSDARRARDEAEDRLLRLRADFDNFRKRTERERAEINRYATASLVERLLPVLDNLERALSSVRPGVSADSLAEGVALTQRQLVEELRREGLRPVETVGRQFDPAVHEAVAAETGAEAPPNTVVQELQRGYYFGDRLLRPAMVRVTVDAPDPGGSGESGDADG